MNATDRYRIVSLFAQMLFKLNLDVDRKFGASPYQGSWYENKFNKE